MTTLPKWTEERTAQLIAGVAGEVPVSRNTVADLAVALGTTTRSISAKLRKLDIDVELATAPARAFSDEVTESLHNFVTGNSGAYTYGEIAANFPGEYSAKAIQGKILSMQLTEHVKETPKAETVKVYTADEETKIVALVKAGKSLEDIAAAVGKTTQSVRGKALSLQRAGLIDALPKQATLKASATDPLDALGDISASTVEELAEKLEKTVRGIKTMLTRRGIKVANYDGAAKAEKAAA